MPKTISIFRFVSCSTLGLFLMASSIMGSAQEQSPKKITFHEGTEVTLPLAQKSEEVEPGKLKLASGTSVILRLMHGITSKNAMKGDLVSMRVLEAVKSDGLVVIAAGTPATGRVVKVKPAGMAWQAGRFVLQFEPVTLVNGQQVRLESERATKGAPIGDEAAKAWWDAMELTQGGALLFLPLAPLQHGNQAVLQMGNILDVGIQGDALLDVSSIKANQPLQTARPDDPGFVTIYYPYSGEGGAIKSKAQMISCGKLKLGAVAQGQSMTVTLDSGRYWFRSQMKNDVVLDVEGGGDYYLRLQSDQSTPTHDMKLIQVPHDVGKSDSVGIVTSTTATDLKSLSSKKRAKLQIQSRSVPAN